MNKLAKRLLREQRGAASAEGQGRSGKGSVPEGGGHEPAPGQWAQPQCCSSGSAGTPLWDIGLGLWAGPA